MSALSDYLENALVNGVLRGTTFTAPATVYVALYTAAPSDAGGGTQVSGGAYARQSAAFTAPSNGATSNSADITFPIATADWGTVSHFGIFDAATAGNLLIHGAFSVAKPIYNGDQFIIRAGDLDVTFA
jgi:hypothetical protein